MDIHESVFVAPGAAVVGDVTIGEDSSVWYCVAIRSDAGPISIGKRTNIQDGAVLHGAVTVGDDVSVGHNALVHGCVVEDDVLVGMGSIILNDAHIGKGAVVAAGALVPEGMVVPAGTIAMGCPAKIRGPVSEELAARAAKGVQEYLGFAANAKKNQSK